MYKILLTGSSGFIGSNILNSFSEKYKFYVIVRKKIPKKKLIKKNIKFIYFKTYESLNSKLKKIKVDIVIHCATYYTKTHRFSDIKKFCNSNLLLGNIILENLNSMKVSKFINFSTVWEDGNAQKNNTINLYAAYKKSFSVILNFYRNSDYDKLFPQEYINFFKFNNGPLGLAEVISSIEKLNEKDFSKIIKYSQDEIKKESLETLDERIKSIL